MIISPADANPSINVPFLLDTVNRINLRDYMKELVNGGFYCYLFFTL